MLAAEHQPAWKTLVSFDIISSLTSVIFLTPKSRFWLFYLCDGRFCSSSITWRQNISFAFYGRRKIMWQDSSNRARKKKKNLPNLLIFFYSCPSNSLQVLHLGTQQTTNGKYFLRKFRNFKKEKLEFANADNDLHSIYIILDLISNLVI